MSRSKCPMDFLSRRGFIKSAGAGLGALALGSALSARAKGAEQPGDAVAASGPAPDPSVAKASADGAAESAKLGEQAGDAQAIVAFHGHHQSGITTPQQMHSYFVALDLVTPHRADVIAILKSWTAASARLTQGKTALPLSKDPSKAAEDSGDALGLSPARLTLTFGFGPGLFSAPVTKKAHAGAPVPGADRYGLLKHKPEALADLPVFHGDQLVPAICGGDLSIQACADDLQVAFHAIRQLVRLASPHAQVRWAQSGFVSAPAEGSGAATPRNLMGFKDGTQQPDEKDHDAFVWVGPAGPAWMRGGSYLVTRKVRIALEHWEGTEVDFQEQVIGRHKHTGAPLGKSHERDDLGLDRADRDGNPLIPENAHVRLASREANGGAQMLRRGYSYNDGVNFTAERWPPWRQGIEYDAGLFFVSYQADPRTGFSRVFGNLARLDALNQFATHVGSALFACPPGVAEGEYIGQKLFEAT